MTYTTIEADISHGQITVREPQKLPTTGQGLLIVLPATISADSSPARRRITLPLIHGDGSRSINPSPEELDDSLWD